MKNIERKIYKRPWGSYQTLKLSENFQVKLIQVNPKQRLSLQKHLKRKEHWIIVQGIAKITVGKIIKKYKTNDYVYIPMKAMHRIENPSKELLIFVEVQIGSYLGEDDIIRYEDVYGRV